MSYFISPPENPNWRIDADSLAEQLLARWPEAQIEKVTQPASLHALSWTLWIGEWRLDGTLTKDGTVVHLEGDVRACAVFATWFRSIVPSQQELIFYDDDYSADVPLTPSTTEDELSAPFLSS